MDEILFSEQVKDLFAAKRELENLKERILHDLGRLIEDWDASDYMERLPRRREGQINPVRNLVEFVQRGVIADENAKIDRPFEVSLNRVVFTFKSHKELVDKWDEMQDTCGWSGLGGDWREYARDIDKLLNAAWKGEINKWYEISESYSPHIAVRIID